MTDLQWHYFDIRLRVPFRGQTSRRGAVVRGPFGWGEYSPFPGFGSEDFRAAARSAYSAAFAPWPEPVRDAVPVHVTVPALGPREAADLVRFSGCSAAKVKVAEGADEARVEAVREALGPGGRLVLDANGGWDTDEAIRRIRVFCRYSVDLVEQPVRTIEGLAEVRRSVDVPIAADESACSEEAVLRLVKLEAADVLVIKVQSLGGVAEAQRIIEVSGLPAVVSSMLETSVGMAAGLALAAALENLPYPCGLGTVGLLDGDLVADSLLPRGGRLTVRRPEVDQSLLERYADRDPVEVPVGGR
ncbi:MAG: o-succinylbenzoate synthase [Actinomycetota bacterium]